MVQLYYGGDIITMESKEDKPEAVVVKEGTILYVGSLAEAEKVSCDAGELERINLEGKTLMPSFIDPHGHISLVAQFSSFCSLSECRSYDDIITTLKAFKEEKKITEEGVIIGCSYDHNFLNEQSHPSKEVLDKVSKDIPIFILHTSAHMGVANSALLELAGISKETKDPQGGLFGRDPEGNPNGYVEESPAMAMIIMSAFSRIKVDFVQQMLAAQQLYLSNGITTVQDGAAGYQSLKGMTAIAESKLFKVDVVSYIMTDDYKKAAVDYSEYFGDYKNGFRVGGAKIVLDGSPQGKSAWLSKPYENETDYCGYPTHKTEYVKAAVEDAVKGGYQLLAHCNGDAASEQFIDCYEEALKEYKTEENADLRPVMIHCQTVRDDQLDRMSELNMIPSIFVAHTYYWGDIHLKNLGPVRGANISPVKSALERGLVYNFHQDPPVVKPDMMHTVWCAVNRFTRTGQPIGQNQCIDVYDALKGVTINGAYEYHEEDKKGSLKAGKLADMVVLNNNPLKVEKMQLAGIKVCKTIKAGEVVFES
ncbi:MAG: amidohydrolase [Eubacteriales bacterium]|nr:amidohydrolase [Eubacteriales bacterium]